MSALPERLPGADAWRELDFHRSTECQVSTRSGEEWQKPIDRRVARRNGALLHARF